MNGFGTTLPFLKPIEHLILDDPINEVMVNGPDRVSIEKQSFHSSQRSNHKIEIVVRRKLYFA